MRCLLLSTAILALAACGGGGGDPGGGDEPPSGAPPTARVLFPTRGSLTSDEQITVRGIASDPDGVAAVLTPATCQARTPLPQSRSPEAASLVEAPTVVGSDEATLGGEVPTITHRFGSDDDDDVDTRFADTARTLSPEHQATWS